MFHRNLGAAVSSNLDATRALSDREVRHTEKMPHQPNPKQKYFGNPWNLVRRISDMPADRYKLLCNY